MPIGIIILKVLILTVIPIAVNTDEKDSMKKLKYLKYNNKATPISTPTVVIRFDFFVSDV